MSEPIPIKPDRPTTQLMVLHFTDVVDSVGLKTRLGTTAYAGMISRHDEIFRALMDRFSRAEVLKDLGDGFLTRFQSTSDAVNASLLYQRALEQEPWAPERLQVRIGIHLGEVAVLEPDIGGKPKLIGLTADLSARIMGLARPGQILMTRAAFDDARQYVREHPVLESGDAPELEWMAHGPYRFKGADEPTDVFEVGAVALAPLEAPPDCEKARRVVHAGEEDVYGWRPAIGRAIPRMEQWEIERKLGEGGFGEVWLARLAKTGARRVFKFCFDVERLRSLKRELTLFRLLRESLGERPDIVALKDIQLDRPPFYLESEFCDHGDLGEWTRSQGGAASLPLETKLDLIARVADAVAAAHSVGVLHKDIKPSNILITIGEDGGPRPKLADFGIGMLTDRSALERHDITMAGFTETLVAGNESTRTGTRLYAPPESLIGEAFTIQGDIFALGVVLYQLITGDLNRPLGQGWEGDVEDALLRDDIKGCVMRNPRDRFADAEELARRLRALDDRREELRRRREESGREARRRRLLRMAGLAAIILVLLSVGLTIFAVSKARLAHRELIARQQAERLALLRSAEAAIALREGRSIESAGRLADLQTDDAPALLVAGALSLLSDPGLYAETVDTIPPPPGVLYGGAIEALAWNDTGDVLVGARDDGLWIWNGDFDRPPQELELDPPIESPVVTWSPDGLRFIVHAGSGLESEVIMIDLAGDATQSRKLGKMMVPVTPAWIEGTSAFSAVCLTRSVNEDEASTIEIRRFDGKSIDDAPGSQHLHTVTLEAGGKEPRQRIASHFDQILEGSFIRAFGVACDASAVAFFSTSYESQLLIRASGPGRWMDVELSWPWPIRDCHWSPTGDTLAVADTLGYLTLVTPDGARLLRSPVDTSGFPNSRISQLRWSPDGGWIALMMNDKVFVFSSSGDKFKYLKTGDLTHARFDWTDDGEQFAVSRRGQIQVWAPGDRSHGVMTHLIDVSGHINSLAWQPGAPILIASDGRGAIHRFDLDAPVVPQVMRFAGGGRTELRWNPTGDRLLVAGRDGGCTFAWPPTAMPRDELHRWNLDGLDEFEPVADLDRMTGAVSGGGFVWLHPAPEERTPIVDPDGRDPIAVATDDRGRMMAIVDQDGQAHIRDLQRDVDLATLSLDGTTIQDAVWSSAGDRLATSARNGTLAMWNAQGERLWIVSGTQLAWPGKLVWSRDASIVTLLVGNPWPGVGCAWDAASGSPRDLGLAGAYGFNSAWHPDRPIYATTTSEGMIEIWEVTSSNANRLTQEFVPGALELMWSPAADLLLYKLRDGGIGLFEPFSDEPTGVIDHTSLPVLDIQTEFAVSPDGDYLVTAHVDGVVRLWPLDWTRLRAMLRDRLDRVPRRAP